MWMRTGLAALAAILAGAGGALAEPTSEVIYQLRSWQVLFVTYDDQTTACVAQVSDGSDSFSIISDPATAIRLQFFSESWDFGEGDTANLEVQIDRRSPWSLSNAELYLNSVLFDLPDSDAGVNFVTEVMRGNILQLRNEQGEDVMRYSLSGSSASIGAMIDCVDRLGRASNPFR